MIFDYDSFCRNLKTLRELAGYNKFQMSIQTNLHYQYYCNIENGNRIPSFKNVIAIANALKISITQLLNYEILKDDSLLEQSILTKLRSISDDIESLKKLYEILIVIKERYMVKKLKEYNGNIIGKQIQKYRLSKDYSVKKLSELTGISESYIRELERGKSSKSSSISMEKICRISEALSVSLDDLAYTNIEYPNSTSNSLLNDIEMEIKSLSHSDMILFKKIVNIFLPNHKC